jgi:hypothetical protein
MTRWSIQFLSIFLVCCAVDAMSFGQTDTPTAAQAQRSVVRKRRVGHLKINPNAEQDLVPYLLRDVWDQRTYLVAPARGLDLSSYLDRYVALHGTTTRGSDSDDDRQFSVEKVIALDARRGDEGEPFVSAVRQADHEVGGPLLPHPAAPLPSEVLAPNLEVGPIPFENIVEIPIPDPEFLEPGLAFEPCPGCGLKHWDLRSSMANWIGPGAGGGCCGPTESLWVRAEYLLWWTDGLRLPPLVTTSPDGTPRANAGVLGEAETRVLSSTAVNNDSHSGLRIRAGTWLDGAGHLGIGGDYYALNNQVSRLELSSDGSPILARPFYDILNGQETAELVGFPGVISGSVAAEARTEFRSAGIHLRINLCCNDWSANACGHDGSRLDALVGYRFGQLKDDLVIVENLTSQDPANPGSFDIHDAFHTENEFHGAELGIQYQRQRGRLLFEFLSKMALGNNHQVVTIGGSTRLVSGGVDMTFPSGILAQRTNIGRFARDEFAILPEVGVNVGYQVTPRLKMTLGYTLVYLSNVVRAGDQIDRDVNPNLFPPEAVPFAGPLRPEFAFRETDFWAQGLSVGGDLRF